MTRLLILLCLIAGPALSETVFTTRTVRSQDVITADDVVLKDGSLPGTVGDLARVIGYEARVVLYAGRPVLINDISPPALIERNQTVTLVFNRSGLRISTDGRALERGARGDFIKAMNLSSRSTVTGVVTSDGHIEIGQ